MPLTIKKKKRQEEPLDSSSCSAVDTGKLHSFQREYNAADDYASRYTVLRRWWWATCKSQMPELNNDVLSSLLGYEIALASCVAAGLPFSEKMAINLRALRENKMDRLTPGMKGVLDVLVKTTEKQGESNMNKKKGGKEVNAVKAGVSQFYLEVFEGQAKAQLTDAQIAKAIGAKTGSEPTLKNVASYRCMYNAGELQGQKSVPAARVKAVRPKSDKPAKAKKPMSEETKAKLKAYSAKKKAEKAKVKILPKNHKVRKILKKVKD